MRLKEVIPIPIISAVSSHPRVKLILKRLFGTPIVIFAIILFSALAVAGPCHAKEKKITLTLWELSANEQLMQKLLDKFEAENPSIKVELQQLTWEYGLDKFVISLAAGNPPDICELGSTWVAKFASSGVLLDITNDISDMKKKYFLWDCAAYENKIYGIPWFAGTRALFYNKDLFAKADLDPEVSLKTWADLLYAARRIHDPQKGVWGFSICAGEPESPWQEFLPFAWSNGAKILSENSKECLLDSGETLKALEFYKKISKYSLIERQSQINELFAEGKVGIQISGSWNLRLIPRLNPELKFGVSFVPSPQKENSSSIAFAGGEVLSITKHSPYPQEALKLVRFLTSNKNIMEIVKVQQNVVPAQREALLDDYYKQHPPQKVFLMQLDNAMTPPSHPRWTEIQEYITTMIEETIMKNTQPRNSLRKAALNIQGLLVKQSKTKKANKTLILSIFIFVVAILIIPAMRVIKKNLKSFLYLSPWLITFLAFGLYPLVYSIIISFTNYDILTSQFNFIGLKNYASVFLSKDFLRALWHTFVFCIGTVPFTAALALFCAILINRKIPFKQLYQSGLFLPVTTSVIVIATIFTYIYSPGGLANRVLDRLGILHPQSSWLNSPQSWLDISVPLLSIMAMNIWASFGYYTILFLAGLQTIPDNLYEVASLDGATEWQKFRYITFPQLKSIILLVIVLNTIYSLQVFPEIFTMTMGGPLGSTTTAVYHIYELGFHKFDMGKASSAAYILSSIIMLLSLLHMKLIKVDEQLKE